MVKALLDSGWVANAPRPHVIRVAPPLIVSPDEIERFVAALEDVYKRQVHEHRPRPARDPGPDRDRSRPVSTTAAQGFVAAGVTAGIKASGRPDLALVVNTGPDKVCAAVYTSNRFQAAPVLWSKGVTASGVLDLSLIHI